MCARATKISADGSIPIAASVAAVAITDALFVVIVVINLFYVPKLKRNKEICDKFDTNKTKVKRISRPDKLFQSIIRIEPLACINLSNSDCDKQSLFSSSLSRRPFISALLSDRV